MTTAAAATTGSVSASGASASSSSAKTALDNNYELFLSILTTQIQNQDPLDPMDSSKYTEQLVQYSSVEQQIKTNDQLGGMLQIMAASTASSYVSYLGTSVVASGATTQLQSGEANWTYNAEEGGEALVEIRNSMGAVVYQGKETLSQGKNSYTWDGRTSAGSTAPDGQYSIDLVQVDDKGQPVRQVQTEVKGVVEGVEFTGSGALLTVGGAKIPASAVISVNSN